MRIFLIPAALFCLLLPAPAQAQEACPDPDMAQQEAALKAVNITTPAPGQALQGTRNQPARDGGTWFVSVWRPCSDRGPGDDLAGLTLTLHHSAGSGPARLVASGTLPDLAGGAPSDPAVLEQAKAAVVLADVWTGGNCAGCEHVAVLAVDGSKLVDVPPPAHVVINNLDAGTELQPGVPQSAPLTFLGFDPRWTGLGGLPDALAPTSTIRLQLDGRTWVETCTAARTEYLGSAFDQSAILDSLLAGPPPDDGTEIFGLALSIALDQLNAGEPASKVQAALDQRLAARNADPKRWPPPFQRAAERVRAALQNAAASGALQRGCPSLGLALP